MKIWANSLKIQAKIAPNLLWLKEMAPNVFHLKSWSPKSHENVFFGGHPKNGLQYSQKTWPKSFSGTFGEIRAKILRTPRKLPAPTPMGYSIAEPFRPEELAAALRRLKPGKSPGLDSIFQEFILHAGSALKSCFCAYLTSGMRLLKLQKSTNTCDP